MAIVEASWHQHFHALAEHFRAAVSEEPLGQRIREHNSALLIDDNDCVRCRLEQRAKFPVALFHRPLRLPALGDVLDGQQDPFGVLQ